MEQITITEKNKYSTKDIAKWVRSELKKKYPSFKFSVTYESYSGGSSINVNLMESPIKIVKDYSDIKNDIIEFKKLDGHNIDDLKARQIGSYHQLNHYTLLEDYKESDWCNGVFLTEKGHNLLKEVVKISNKYNWDKSDIMTDYVNVNYYLHLNLGKWDKPFIDGVDL